LKVVVVQFPGSNCDRDTLEVLNRITNIHTSLVWHDYLKEPTYDAVVIPGGFSFGDHLRAGIIAANTLATDTIRKMAEQGKPVLGICNGFQILIEAGLLPGSLLRNSSLKFVCKWLNLELQNYETAFTCSLKGEARIRMPIAHNEGRYFADDATLDRLKADGLVVMTYAGENPTGTSRRIAAVSNKEGNVVGMMPHPERASNAALGGEDGLKVFESMLEWARC
jgi:phosphoribosylformylglycinamidine synthase